MGRRHISITNDRLDKILSNSINASKLIELAVLYYVDNIENINSNRVVGIGNIDVIRDQYINGVVKWRERC